MSTRGFIGWVVEGKVTTSYNHCDSNPAGLGNDVLAALKATDLEVLGQRLSALRLVDEDGKPTPEECERYSALSQQVSAGDDWYAVLRGLQGDLLRMLEYGIATENPDVATQSDCEWGYLVDCDIMTLEVYEGFQKTSPRHGRWAGQPVDGYAPVERVAFWSWYALPENMNTLEKELARA